MAKVTKAMIDQEIYELVKEGKMTKTAIAAKYNTSTRSVGRAVERVEAAMKAGKSKAKPKSKAKTSVKDLAKSATQKTPVAVAVKAETPKTLQERVMNGDKPEYIITGDSVILTAGDAEPEIVESTHPSYEDIVVAVVKGDFEKALKLMNIRKSIEDFSRGCIQIKGEKLFYGAVEVRSTLADRIIEAMRNGEEGFESLVNFFEKLMENPSKQSVEQLWGFISHLDVEIDKDGYIIGWKKVQSKADGSLVDSHTHKVPNDLGNLVEMPRWMVDNDPNRTCSQGLHVGAWDYVSCFGGNTILKVRVHPRDVVSVPVDYDDMKMRVSAYESFAIVDNNRKVIKTHSGTGGYRVVIGTNGELISKTERV